MHLEIKCKEGYSWRNEEAGKILGEVNPWVLGPAAPVAVPMNFLCAEEVLQVQKYQKGSAKQGQFSS